MTSVRTVLVVGGGTAGCALATLLGRAGVAVEIVERKPDFTALRVRHHPAGRGAAGAARGRGVGRAAPPRLRVRLASGCAPRTDGCSPRSRTPEPGDRTCPPRSARTGPSWPNCSPPPPSTPGAKVRLGTTVASFTQDDDGVDVVFSDGDTGRYDLLVGADGVRSQPSVGSSASTSSRSRSGWASGGCTPAAPPAWTAPTWSTTAPATSPATARPARTPSTPTSSRPRQDRFADTPEQKVAHDARARRGLPRSVGRDPRGHHRRRPDQLHPVRAPADRRPVEPRPGRRHRRRRPRLPAHPRARARRWRWRTRPSSPSCC